MTPELKKKLVVGGASAALLLGAFATGRYTVPTQIETKDRIVKVEDTTKVTQLTNQIAQLSTQIDTLRSENDLLHKQVTKLKLAKHVVTHTVTHPDGTIDQTQTSDTTVNTSSQTTDQSHSESQEQHQGTQATSQQTQQTTSETSHSVTDETHTKVVTNEKPQWLLTGGIGFDVGNISFSNGFSTGPLAFNASVERRILGPFFVGPQVTYDRHFVVGVAASLEF